MYNILLLGVHRLFYLGTNSWLTGEAANNTQSWQFCLLSVQLSCKATRRIMVHSFTALTHVFTAFSPSYQTNHQLSRLLTDVQSSNDSDLIRIKAET